MNYNNFLRISGMKKLFAGIFFPLLLIIFLYALLIHPLDYEDKTILDIKYGSNCEKILKEMASLNLINDSFYQVYKMFFSSLKLDTKIQSGRFIFEKKESPYKIFAKIIKNTSDNRVIYIPSGITNDKIFRTLISSNNLYIDDNCMYNIEEGSILPGKYFYFAGEPCSSVVLRMQQSMDNFLDSAISESNCNLSKKEIKTLASIVEKESSIVEERRIIAGVFLNRLNKGWKLQADPTAIYGYNKNCGDFIKKITQLEIQDKNNYNTYFIKGIPIEPICSPSKSSIMSVIQPEMSDAMFFVRKNIGGGHHFTNSYDEHIKKVQLLKK